jgi:cytochrome P450
VHYVEEAFLWYVTTRDLVEEALRKPDVFSSQFGAPQLPLPPSVAERVAEVQARGWPVVPTMLTQDPPAHDYYRRLVSRAFTPRHIENYHSWISELIEGLITEALGHERFELVSGLAAPFSLAVIAHILNVPEQRLPDFRRWSDEISLSIGTAVSEEGAIRGAETILEFQHYFAEELEQRRRQPQDDLLSRLVHAHALTEEGTPDDKPLSTEESLSIIMQLLVAGNETSAKMISSAIQLLGEYPSWWRWLQESPLDRAPAVVEETLRHLSPAQGMLRVTTQPTTLGGVELPTGALVLLSYASANRDEAVFESPDTFDPNRTNARSHLAFGLGTHFCIGAPLVRLEGKIVLARLAERVNNIEILDDELLYTPSFVIRGLQQLNVRLTAAAPGPRTNNEHDDSAGSGVL